MRGVLQCAIAMAALVSGLLAPPPAAAQAVDKAVVGTWSGSDDAGKVTLALSRRGKITGSVARGPFDCVFSGDVAQHHRSKFRFFMAGRARLDCVDPSLSDTYRVDISATASALDFTVSDDGLGFSMKGLTRGALGATMSSQILSSEIPGHWQGTDHGITAVLDLAANGGLSAMMSGIASPAADLDGCVLEASFPPDEAFQNDDQSFVDMGEGRISQCTQASVDGFYAILVTAAPGRLAITVMDADNQVLFEAQGLARSAPALASVFSAQIANSAIPGRWEGRSETARVILDLDADGTLSGTFLAGRLTGCRFQGSVPPDEALENDENKFLAIGLVKLSRCGRFDGYFAPVIDATSAIMSFGLFRYGQALVELKGMIRIGP